MRRPSDTSPAARRRQLDAYRAMRPQERLRLAVVMSAEVRALTRSGILARHPEYSADEVERALADILLGQELAATLPRRRAVGAR